MSLPWRQTLVRLPDLSVIGWLLTAGNWDLGIWGGGPLCGKLAVFYFHEARLSIDFSSFTPTHQPGAGGKLTLFSDEYTK